MPSPPGLRENYAQVLPKSIIAKAMAYTMTRWEQLSNYLMDGMLEIDHNKIDNAIRPVALHNQGRKNYLFARITRGGTACSNDLLLFCYPDIRDR